MATSIPEETYNRIATILRDYRKTDADIEEMKTILGGLEQHQIQDLLTQERKDVDKKRPTNLLCMARDPESISVLLDSITDKTSRLDMLLVQETIGSPLPSSLFHKYCDIYSVSGITFLNFVRSIVERLSPAGVRKFLTTRPTDNKFSESVLQKVLRSRPRDPQQEEEYIDCIKFILDAVSPEERLALLQSDGSRLSPIHCVLDLNQRFPSYDRRLLQLILDYFPPENQRVQLLKTIDQAWDGRSFFWKIQIYGDDELKQLVFEALEAGDLIEIISMRDRQGLICLVEFQGRDMLLKNIIKRRLGYSTMLKILQLQASSNGETVTHTLSNQPELFIATMNTITKPDDIVTLLSTPDWSGSTAFDLALGNQVMLSWVIKTIHKRELRHLITSRKALFHLTRSDLFWAVKMLLDGFNDKEKVEIFRRTDEFGNTPLHIYGSMTLIKDILCLIQVDNPHQLLQAQNDKGETPLHRCEFDPQTFVEIFQHIPSPRTVEVLAMQDNLGNTIVHHQSQQAIVQVITELNIDEPEQFLSIQNDENRTVFHNIVHKKPQIDCKINPYFLCYEALKPPYISTLVKCVKKEPERYSIFSCQDKHGQTVLHGLLCNHLTMAALSELLEKGFEKVEHWYKLMAIADWNGNTPIHMMSRCPPNLLTQVIGKIPTKERLSLLSIPNENEDTVLHVAAYNPDAAKTVDIVLSHLDSADQLELLEKQNRKSLTAIQIAVETGNFSCKAYIVSRIKLETIFQIQFSDFKWTEFNNAIKNENKKGLLHMLKAENLETLWLLQQLMTDAAGELDPGLREVIENLREKEIKRAQKYIEAKTHQQLKTEFQRLQESEEGGDKIDQVMIPQLSTNFRQGGSILHMLSKRKCTALIKKLLQAMGSEQRNVLLSLENNNGKTALDLARSYEIRKLLEWSSVQRGFYYLPTPPHIIVMYVTKNRGDKNKGEQEYLDLKKTLDLFDATVIYKKDPGGDEMLNIVTETARKQMSALVVIIMSHGMLGHVRGADDKDIKIEKILKNMCSTTMVGKPKVLLVQACQNRVKKLQPKETGTFNMPSSDMMAMMASVGGQAAHGNLMIPMFAEELRNAPEDEDIYDTFLCTHQRMLEELREVEDKGQQTPEFRSTLTHKLRLKRKITSETPADTRLSA